MFCESDNAMSGIPAHRKSESFDLIYFFPLNYIMILLCIFIHCKGFVD